MNDLRPLVSRYKHVRKVSERFNSRMMNIVKEAFGESAIRLGLTRRNEILLNDENELLVIAEHATYDIVSDGNNVVQRFLDSMRLREGSDEAIVAQAMRNARHSVYVAQETQPGAGVQVRDEFDGTQYDVIDIGFSHSVKAGGRIAMRLLPLEGFWMSTGVPLPVDEPLFRRISQRLRRDFPEGVTAARADAVRRSYLNSLVIRTCIEAKAASAIEYAEPGEVSSPRRRITSLPGTDVGERHKVGRNELCPCGSGVKYKKCCGRVGRGSMLGSV